MQWNDVKEVQAELNKDVLVWCNNTKEMMVAFRNNDLDEFQFGSFPGKWSLVCKPDYWAELPDEPNP